MEVGCRMSSGGSEGEGDAGCSGTSESVVWGVFNKVGPISFCKTLLAHWHARFSVEAAGMMYDEGGKEKWVVVVLENT